MSARLSFEPLRPEHLSQLQVWLSRPHVARWWGAAPTLAAVEAEYLPGIEGREPTHHHLVLLDGRPIGMIQWYRHAIHPDTSEDGDIGVRPGEAGIDYFIGEPDLIGHGVGAEMIRRYVREIVFADPEVTGVRTSVHADNRRSWRCLEKAGFTRGDALPHPARHLQYAPHLDRNSAARND